MPHRYLLTILIRTLPPPASESAMRLQPISLRPAIRTLCGGVLAALSIAPGAWAQETAKPNVVLMFPDNLGVGEVSAYGGPRGVPTPNIDRIAQEGMRLTNFNVEYSCVVSRIALLTGRYAPRTGEGYRGGMTLWEVTIAETLREAGYSTALFGKWHVGGDDWEGRREPTDQGFDRWWGIPGTSHTAQFTSFPEFDSTYTPVPYLWEGVRGQPARRVRPYDLDTRPTTDREAAERGIAFMEENAEAGRPFFLFYPMTQVHFPALAHPDFAGSTGAGDMGDAMADVDHNVGLILGAIDRLGIGDNTLVLWCSDNGAEMRRPWRGSAGPWRGFYNSVMEGGIRTPCVIRWPGRIPAGQVSNDVVHEVDLFPTIAAAAGASDLVPRDRIIDGMNLLPFLEGRTEVSPRGSALFVAREGHVMAAKWGNWKMRYLFRTEVEPDSDNLVRLFDLTVDPREEIDVKDFYPGVITVMDSIVAEYEASLIQHPRVPGGIDDPYEPPPPGSGLPTPTYRRVDRGDLGPRSQAIPDPDFTGAWSTTSVSSTPPTGQIAQGPTPSLGSGWGDRVTIRHTPDSLQVDRVFFLPREIQPTIRYRYALDGSRSENRISVGRSEPPWTSEASWNDHRLTITTTAPFRDPATGTWTSSQVIQTLWLRPAPGPPFEPSLVVETTRGALLGGRPSTTRTIYTRGYR